MLLAELEKPETDEKRRLRIGDDLDLLGDPREGIGVRAGVPETMWLPVDGSNGKYKFEFGEFQVKPFFIAKYQVTFAQYQAFIKAEDGFNNPEWWLDFPGRYRPQPLTDQRTKNANNPRDSVSWYQSVAFARWLNHRLRGLRIPNAQVGTPFLASEYADGLLPVRTGFCPSLRAARGLSARMPKFACQRNGNGSGQLRAVPSSESTRGVGGSRDTPIRQPGYANTNEAGLGRAVAVGMYPHGAAESGALDMAGNLWEWCLNDHNNPEIIDGYSNGESKVLRGGAFAFDLSFAAASYRYDLNPNSGNGSFGFRLVLGAPIASLTSESLDSESLKLLRAQRASKGGMGGIPPQDSPRQRSQFWDFLRRRK